MLKWVEPFIWGVCRVLAFILQLAGCTGVLLFILIGIWALAGRIDQM
jgi:hypothetical protein